MSRRASYGVDGWQFVVGLLAVGLVTSAMTFVLSRPWCFVTGGVAIVSLLPAMLGLHYVWRGKLRLRDRMLACVVWRGDERVLDVGTGGGLLLIGAAKRAREAVGIDLWSTSDLSNNSRERALENAAIEGVSVDVRDGDARALPFDSGAFDVILSTLCLHNIEDAAGRDVALRELARVLAPRGTILISDLAHIDRYAQVLSELGLTVTRSAPLLGTFPFQRLIVARRG